MKSCRTRSASHPFNGAISWRALARKFPTHLAGSVAGSRLELVKSDLLCSATRYGQLGIWDVNTGAALPRGGGPRADTKPVPLQWCRVGRFGMRTGHSKAHEQYGRRPPMKACMGVLTKAAAVSVQETPRFKGTASMRLCGAVSCQTHARLQANRCIFAGGRIRGGLNSCIECSGDSSDSENVYLIWAVVGPSWGIPSAGRSAVGAAMPMPSTARLATYQPMLHHRCARLFRAAMPKRLTR